MQDVRICFINGEWWTPKCDCGDSIQSTSHIINKCPKRKSDENWDDIINATPKVINFILGLDIDL